MNPLLLAQQAPQTKNLQNIVDSLAKTPLSEIVIVVVVLTLLRLAVSFYMKSVLPHKRAGVYKFAQILNEGCDAIIYAAVFVFMIVRPFMVQTFLVPSGSMWPTIYVQDFILGNKAVYRYTDPKVNDIVVFRPPVRATIHNPEQRDESGNVTADFVKRCVAGPGDVIEVRKGVLYRNGQAVPDSFRHFSRTTDDVNFEEIPAAEVNSLPMASFKLIKWKGQIIPLNYIDDEANAVEARKMGQDYVYGVHPDFMIESPADQLKAIHEAPQPVPPHCYFMMGDDRNDSEDSRYWGFVTRENVIGRAEFIWFPISRIQKLK